MSKQEARRLVVIEQVINKQITQGRAAELLGLSLSRIKVLTKQVRTCGTQAVVHGNVGRSPVNTKAQDIRKLILELYTTTYQGFNFTHFTEKLQEIHHLQVSRPTVYRILTQAGISSCRTLRRPKQHHRRQPKPREGELVQLDASKHDWFSNGGYSYLHGAIDDATSRVLALCFAEEELTEAYFDIMWDINASYGLPLAVYTDARTIFINTRGEDKLSIEQQLAGINPRQTQFSRAMNDIGVHMHIASSPEAKGRIERLWGTLQDRLIKELRLAGISSIEQANAWLPSFIKTHNRKFSRSAKEAQPAFRPHMHVQELELVLCRHEPRKLDRGLAFSYHNETYVLPERHKKKLLIARASQTVTVLESQRFGLKAQLMIDNETITVTPKLITKQPRVTEAEISQAIPFETLKANGRIGAANSPWSRYQKVPDSKSERL